jgi:hypothetical protein
MQLIIQLDEKNIKKVALAAKNRKMIAVPNLLLVGIR